MLLLKNKSARHDYEVRKELMAGIVLTGPEVKSLRLKKGSLSGSYVKIVGDEAWLINAQINPYQYATQTDYDPKRSRKLLLTKKQIFQLKEDVHSKNYAIIPLALVLMGNKIKLELGAGPGKREYEKRAKLKQRDLKRRMAKEFKQTQLRV